MAGMGIKQLSWLHTRDHLRGGMEEAGTREYTRLSSRHAALRDPRVKWFENEGRDETKRQLKGAEMNYGLQTGITRFFASNPRDSDLPITASPEPANCPYPAVHPRSTMGSTRKTIWRWPTI